METLREQQRDSAQLQERMAAITATARSSQDLVEASVNSRGIVIEVKFHPEAVERSGGLAALGRYVTEAVQKAAQDAAAQVDELMAPTRSRLEGLPQANELFPGMPSPSEFIPEPVEPSLAPPNSPERQTTAADDPDVYFAEVETVERSDSSPIDRSW
nr:YbaB/EbfC family nucleoid-associated protein [Gordonia araii]